MMRRRDSIAVHRIMQKKHKLQGPVADGEPAVLQLGKHGLSAAQKPKEELAEAGKQLEAGTVPDTSVSPTPTGQPQQKRRRMGRGRSGRGFPPMEGARADYFAGSPEGRFDVPSPRTLVVPHGGPLFPTSQTDAFAPGMYSAGSPMGSPMTSPMGSPTPRFPGPCGVPGGMPMGPMPPMGMMDMRGRMPRRRRRGRGRERKGPYAVGDSASKGIAPDKIQFSRIKMSPDVPQAEVPPVLHSPIFEIGSPATTPRGGSPLQRESPAASMISTAPPERQREKKKSQPRDGPVGILPDQGDRHGMASAALSPIAGNVSPVATETPAVMLESGDRGFCDFRFTVGLDRVVRGALSRNESLGQQARRKSPADNAADYSKEDPSGRLAQSEALGPSSAPNTPETDAVTSKSPQPLSGNNAGRAGVADLTSSTARARNEFPSSQAEQLSSPAFSWTSKATRATSIDELKLLGSGTETQVAFARRKASMPTRVTESDVRDEIGGDEPRFEEKAESSVLQQKMPQPLPPLDSATFTVGEASPESPLKETVTAAEANAVAQMTISLADFVTTTAHETRSLEERMDKTESPAEDSTLAKTTTMSSEFLATTVAETTSPDEAVSPASTADTNRKNKENSGRSTPSLLTEAARGKAGVPQKPYRKRRNRSGRDKRNQKAGKHRNRKGEERSKRGNPGNRKSKQSGPGKDSPESKVPDKNATKMGSPEARSINPLIPDASTPDNQSPEKKKSGIANDGNASRTQKSHKSKTKSIRKPASEIQGIKNVGDSDRKSPEYKTPGNKSSGKQVSGRTTVYNGTRRSKRPENCGTNGGTKPSKRTDNKGFENKAVKRDTSGSKGTSTLKSASSQYVSGTGRSNTSDVTSRPSKTGPSELTSNGKTSSDPISASRIKSERAPSELKSEIPTSSGTSPQNKVSADGSDSRATSPSRQRSSAKERRQRRPNKKSRQREKKERQGERRKEAVESPVRQGSAGRDQPEVKVRSIDRIAEDYLEQPQGYLCCFLFAGTSLTLLMLLGFTVLYYALSHGPASPPPFLQHGEPETQTYTLSTRDTGDTTLDREVTRIVHYCDTFFCSREARYVESVVASNQRPCVSFYEHVCDKWLRQQPKRPAESEPPLSRDSILQSSLARQLLSLVQHSSEPDMRTAAKLYSSCAVGRLGNVTYEDNTALQTMFERWEIRSWPRTDNENLSHLSVWRFAAELARDLDLATLFIVSVGVDPNDMGATILELDSLRSLFNDGDKEFEPDADVHRSAVQDAMTLVNATTLINVDDFTNRLVKVSGILRSATLYSAAEDFAVMNLSELGEGVRHFIETLLANVPGDVQYSTMKVTAKSPSYVRAGLHNALLSVPPVDALNYMGFLVLVRLAPFLPEHLEALRELFGKVVVSHIAADVPHIDRMCLWLVDHSLPGCFSKALHKWLQQEGHQGALRQWLDHLESVFLEHVPDFTWMNNLSALLVRYRFKRRPVTHFGYGSLEDEDACAPDVPFNATVDNPLLFYLDVFAHRPDRRLRGLLFNSTVLRRRSLLDAGSELRTEVTFDRALHRVHVPAALFNLSVPTNSSFFVFQLARVAVRFYRGLVQALYENPFEKREVPLRFTDESRRRLNDLSSCFVDDAQRSAPVVRGLWSPPSSQRRWSSLGKPLLDQASALSLALRAFDEFLHVRRIWKADDRLADLPPVMAQQLFFIYLALDNCEPIRTDGGGGGVPAVLRVNLPLRHVPQFAEAFNCSPADHMTLSPGTWCNVFRSGAVHLAPASERRQRGTRPMAHFGPLDGPYDGHPIG
ncbi:hypothetical protein HPB50_001136 [Hyalomma asiaticum]|uniref:Uncharacterized protein n=1 Tax=Hyalomma asiaticum TaxID=266040 RepID=A0ACB7SLI3_HYAAI|nr:hypothetical protein HPB50_001136 [Hyalomma asiaticum]